MTNSILKQLFDGELNPTENMKVTNPNYAEVSNKLSDMKENFINSLSEDESQMYEEIEDLNCEYSSMYDYEYFVQGFKIGVELILEVLNLNI